MLILANIIALFHGFIVLPMILLGPFILVFSQKRVRWLEWSFLIIGLPTILSFIITGACLFTTWEQELRRAANAASYSGGFVRHYLGEIGIRIPDIVTTIMITILLTLGFLRLIWLWWESYKIKKGSPTSA